MVSILQVAEHQTKRDLLDFFFRQPMIRAQNLSCEHLSSSARISSRSEVGLNDEPPVIAAVHSQRAVFVDEEGYQCIRIGSSRFSLDMLMCRGVGAHSLRKQAEIVLEKLRKTRE